MAEKTEFLQAINDAILDADSLEQFINGGATETVKTRLNTQYPTIKNAVSQVNSKLNNVEAQVITNINKLFESGGLPATPFKTKALMQASSLADDKYAMVTDDPELSNNGLYIKQGGAWVLSKYDITTLLAAKSKNLYDGVVDEAKNYTDSVVDTVVAKAVSDVPKKGIYADFVKGVYAVNGVECDFDDILKLNRNSAAWLVTELGLKSYLQNEPRIDSTKGLLIENGLTNELTSESLLTTPANSEVTAKRVISDFNSEIHVQVVKSGTAISGLHMPSTKPNSALGDYRGNALRLLTIKKGDSRYVSLYTGEKSIVIDTYYESIAFASSGINAKIETVGNWLTVAFIAPITTTDNAKYLIGFGSSHDGNGVLTAKNYDKVVIASVLFAKSNTLYMSPIPAINSPTTRATESLSAKNNVTTVGGQWTDGVSVVANNGVLSASGYGYIQKLHINASSFSWKDEAVAFWDFKEPNAPYNATYGVEEFPLQDASNATNTVEAPDSPFGRALVTGNWKFLKIDAKNVGALDLGKKGNEVTVVAWIYRESTDTDFIAGMWQEDDTDPRRQYGLFVSLPVYDGAQQVCGHISRTGKPSPGLRYSKDYSATGRVVENNKWQTVGFTYDGQQALSYLQGYADQRPVKNPYFFDEGLNNSNIVSDFTVGGVKLTSGNSHFLEGMIGGVAVFDRALTSNEMMQIHLETLGRHDDQALHEFDYSTFALNRTIEAATGGVSLVSSIAIRPNAYQLSASSNINHLEVGYPWLTTVVSGFKYLYTRSAQDTTTLNEPRYFETPVKDGININRVDKVTLRTNNDNPANIVYVVLRVKGELYVSTQGFTNPTPAVSGADWSKAKYHEVAINSMEWTKLIAREGVELKRGEPAVLPNYGYVDAVGLYADSVKGHIRVDSIKLV